MEIEINKVNKDKKLKLFYESGTIDLHKKNIIKNKNSIKIYKFLKLKKNTDMYPSLFGKEYEGNPQGKYKYHFVSIR